MFPNSIAMFRLKFSLGTMLLVGLYLAVFASDRVPAQDAPAPDAPAHEKGKERRFDSTQPLLVFQIVDGRSQPKFLGMTPTPSKKGIVVPDDDEKWFVVPANEALGKGNAPNPQPAQGNPQPGNGANNPNAKKIKVIRGLGIIGGLGLVGGGLVPLPGMNQLGGLGQIGQLPMIPGLEPKQIPGLDPSKLPAGFAGLPPGFGGGGNLPAGFRGNPAFGGGPAANFSGLPGGDAVPGGFSGGNIIPPKGAPEKPAEKPPEKKKKTPEFIRGESTVSTDDDGPLQLAQLVIPRLPTLPSPKFEINPANPGVIPSTKTPSGKRGTVSEANLKEVIAELRKTNAPGVTFENVALKDSDLAIVTEHTGIKTLVLRNTLITDEGLSQLSKLPALRNLVLDGDFSAKGLAHLKGRSLNILELSGKRVGNDCLAALADLKEIKVLRLRWTRINDAGIKTLVGFKNLQGLGTIELLGQDFTDAALRQLPKLQGLRKVRLYLTRCTDIGLESLAKIADLQALTVDSCSDGLIIPFATVNDGTVTVRGVPSNALGLSQRVTGYSGSGNRILLASSEGTMIVPTGKITNDGIQHIKAMKALKELEITNWNIADAALESLQEAFTLTTLKIDSPHITNRGLASLKELGRLETLDLRCTQITGKGAEHLAKLSALRTVCVALSCTDDDLAAYRKVLPSNAIVSRGNPYEELNQVLGKIAPTK